MFKKLRNRFLLSNLLLTLLVLLGTFIVLFSLVYLNARHDAERRLKALPTSAVENSVTSIPAAGSVGRYLVDIIVDGEHLGSSTFFKISVTSDGEISKSNSSYWQMEEAYRNMARIAWTNRNIHQIIPLGQTKWQVIIVSSTNVSGDYDIFFMDVTSQQVLLQKLFHAFLGIAPLSLLAVFLISLLMANRAVRPITEAWYKQRRFVADASHELKTPLAVIAANADVLLLNAEENLQNRSKWIGYIKDETGRMSKLVNELLALAKIEDCNNPQAYQEFDLRRCASDACVALEAMAYEKGMRLECESGESVFIRSDEAKVRTILSILLDNAIKYTNEGGLILVRLKRHKAYTELSVENSGAGIPADALPHIFDRFYRVDQARENENGSFGLGLSIARSISEQLGATLEARSVPGDTTTFVFRMKTKV